MRIAMIPARGGSKRIPGKNTRLFDGRPIIAYSIEAALACDVFDAVIVSTEDPEIARIAGQHGASTPFSRPQALADDHSSVLEVMAHTLDWYAEQSIEVTAMCCILATAPFIRQMDILAGYKAITEEAFEGAFAATTFDFPVQRALRRLLGGGVELLQPEFALTRSQDLESAYHDAGQFYWVRPESFEPQQAFFTRETKAILLPSYRVQDIDTEEDWHRAELMYRALQDDAGLAG